MTDKKLIQVIGKGCAKCEKQFEYVMKAIEELQKADEYNVEYFKEVEKFAELDVFMTPALRIDDKVVSEGRVLSTEKIKELI